MTQCIAGIYTYDDFHITLKLLDLTLDFIRFQTIIQNLLQVPLYKRQTIRFIFMAFPMVITPAWAQRSAMTISRSNRSVDWSMT